MFSSDSQSFAKRLVMIECTFFSFACEAKLSPDARFFIVKRRDGFGC